MTIFVDTTAFYAVLDRDDAYHAKARAAWERLLGSAEDLLTSNYVLLETCALLQHRLGLPALRAFQEDVAPVFRIHWVASSGHQAAVAALLAAARRKLSLVDCVSFHAMREHGIHTAFCFDRHFREQGFQTIP